MKIKCIFFGKYTEVYKRSFPSEDKDNIIGTIQKYEIVHVEHTIYNDNYFKLQDEDAYIICWLRTENGLIDYACDRGLLKTFHKKYLTNIQKFQALNLNEENKVKLRKEKIVKEIPKKEIIVEEEIPKKKTRTKKERIPATVRNIVWVTHFEDSKKGKCWLCRVEDISSANFECGHVISERNGGKVTVDNLRPICGFCNKSVGTMNMEDFKKKYNIP